MAGWEQRSDMATAWAHFERAERLLEEFTVAACVVYWVSGQGWDSPSNVSYAPSDPVAKGHFVALDLVCTPISSC